MSYEPYLLPSAEKDLTRLDTNNAARILRSIATFAEDYENQRHHALAGQLRGAFRLRVGDYRVVYTSNHQRRRMVVHFIRHRREVYG